MAKEPENSDPASRRVDLDALFRRKYRKVMNYFLGVGLSRDDAADLAQETFLRAHRGLETYRGEASEDTWLYEIARNIFKNWVRDRKALKHQGVEVPLAAPADKEDHPVPELEITDPDPLPIELLIQAERKDLLQEAIAGLPAQRQMCVKLRLKDLKYAEIAGILGVSIETVKSHLYQAREALRPVLREIDS